MKQSEKAIVGIIKDHILWERVTRGLWAVNNAFNPTKNELESIVEYKFSGYENAFLAMGVSDNDDLVLKLGSAFWGMIDETTKADELAGHIYTEWLVTIREHYTQLQEVA